MIKGFTAEMIGPGALAALSGMFFVGPTRDGNLPTKAGRDWLVEKGFAERADGWNWLTRAGVTLAIEIGFDREKDIWQRRGGRA